METLAQLSSRFTELSLAVGALCTKDGSQESFSLKLNLQEVNHVQPTLYVIGCYFRSILGANE